MLGAIRILGPGRLLRGGSAVVVLVLVLAGGMGTVAFAGHRATPGTSRAAGVISTVAAADRPPARYSWVPA